MNTLTRRLAAMLVPLALVGLALGCEPQTTNEFGEQDQPTQDQQQMDDQQPTTPPADEQAGMDDQMDDQQGMLDEQQEPAQDEQPEMAERDQFDEPAQMPEQQDELAAADYPALQPEQQRQIYSEWIDAEEPGQAHNLYASAGLAMLGENLNSVAEHAQQANQQQMQQQDQPGQQDEFGQQDQPDGQAVELDQVDQHTEQLQQAVGQLQDNRNAFHHSRIFQESAQNTVNILSSFEQHSQLADQVREHVDNLNETVENIDPEQPLAAQSDHIQSFFEDSSAAITQISETLETEPIGGGPEEEPADEPMMEQPEQDTDMQQPGEDEPAYDDQTDPPMQ